MSNTKKKCGRCGERKQRDKIVVGAFGKKYLCKACKYKLDPKQESFDSYNQDKTHNY